jgi:beta-lactamase superfamily II metal-dependent hydrolase
MKLSKKDYDQYALLWSVYRFLIDTCQMKDKWELTHFVEAFGLNNESAYYVAMKEEIFKESDIPNGTGMSFSNSILSKLKNENSEVIIMDVGQSFKTLIGYAQPSNLIDTSQK